MIRVLIGDMFESEAQTLVNTVNCVGIMGKGIALEFKNRFPDMYDDYVKRCKTGKVQLGKPYVFHSLLPPWILNFPTKGHWRSVSRLSDIIAGLEYMEQHYREWGITSLACPALGCSNGQLEWRVVGPTLCHSPQKTCWKSNRLQKSSSGAKAVLYSFAPAFFNRSITSGRRQSFAYDSAVWRCLSLHSHSRLQRGAPGPCRTCY